MMLTFGGSGTTTAALAAGDGHRLMKISSAMAATSSATAVTIETLRRLGCHSNEKRAYSPPEPPATCTDRCPADASTGILTGSSDSAMGARTSRTPSRNIVAHHGRDCTPDAPESTK